MAFRYVAPTSIGSMKYSIAPPMRLSPKLSPSSNKPKAKPMKNKFKKGDVVKLTTDYYGDDRSNPIWDGEHGQIKGKVTDTKRTQGSNPIWVKWESGSGNSYYPKDLALVKETPTKAEKPKKLFTAKELLKDLVLKEEAKKEIESVLRQHDNSQKIFEEWGLGKTIEYGKGMTFLFYGKPGTGKTFAAHCISKITGQELLTISASQIQSQEPGGANRNIENAFRTAKSKNKVLLLDECDSLITQRNNVGIILGSEINTLLTEIEKCEGIMILTTNRVDTLDTALERRISLIIEFPEPNFELRQEIWKKIIPKKLPIAKKIKIAKLAEYKLTGGQIKNAILQAARFAAADNCRIVKWKYFMAAISRIQKSKSLLGTASNYISVITKDQHSQSFESNTDKVSSTDKVSTISKVKELTKGKKGGSRK